MMPLPFAKTLSLNGYHRPRALVAWTTFTWLMLIGFGWLAAPQARALAPETWHTDQGLRVLFAPAPALPMLELQLTFAAGSALDGELSGLARLTNTALAHGTSEWDPDTLAERFESVGAKFSTQSARDMGIVSLRTLTEPDWLDQALDTLTRLLAAPAFPDDALARSRRQMQQALLRERQEPGSIASRQFHALLYADHPYGSPPNGREDTLEQLDRAAVQAFYQTFYTAQNGTLALTGALTRSEAEAVAARISAALADGPAAPPLPPVPTRSQTIVERIAFPSEQVHILIGSPMLRRGDPDYFPLTVGNHVLGGGSFTSRLFQDVRTQRGLAYSVFSTIRPMALEGPFLVNMQTGVENAENAVEVLIQALRSFHEHGITEDELKAAQANLTGSFPLGLAANSDIVAHLGVMGFYDLPLDFLATYNDQLEQVSVAEVLRVWQERLNPEALVVVIVGGVGESATAGNSSGSLVTLGGRGAH